MIYIKRKAVFGGKMKRLAIQQLVEWKNRADKKPMLQAIIEN